MRLAAAWGEGRRFLAGSQGRPVVVLGLSTVLLVVWKYAGAPSFFATFVLGDASAGAVHSAAAAVYSFMAGVVLLAVAPALVVKFVLRESLREHGLGFGIPARTLRTIALLTPFLVLLGYLAALDPAVRRIYPLNQQAFAGPGAFALHAATYFAFYLSWEFHFRGFLQAALKPAWGPAGAIAVQTMASVLMHVDKPPGETIGALVGGVLWGWLALRTRSVLSGAVQHWTLGLAVDCFLKLRFGMPM